MGNIRPAGWVQPVKDFDRPADCIQPYPVMWPAGSFQTVADRYAVDELSVRTCKLKTGVLLNTAKD